MNRTGSARYGTVSKGGPTATGSNRSGARQAIGVAVLLSTFGCLGASLLGWVVSGAKVRNSYETFRSAQRLGLEDLTPYRVVWFLVPVLTLGIVLAVLGKRLRLGGALLFAQGLTVGAGGFVVLTSSVPTGSGPWAAMVLGGVGLLVSLLALRSGRSQSQE